ncbi:MAG: NRAMP family divalent metal transporter, partial [Dehalococcoidia bacterium]
MAETPDPAQIPVGTPVTADQADVGANDITKLVVKGTLAHPETGEPALDVESGGLFKKRIVVPADRIVAVKDSVEDGDGHAGEQGAVLIQLDQRDADRLSSFGTSVLPPREEEDEQRDFLGGIKAEIEPLIGDNDLRSATLDERSRRQEEVERAPITPRAAMKALGPGIISGAADNDPTTVGTLAVIGSQTTFGLAWLLILVLPMMASVQAIASAVGVTTGRDLQTLINERFGRTWTWIALAFLAGVNIFTLTADLEGGAAALGLITHLDWRWFTLPLAAGVGALLVFGNYEWVRRALTCVVLVFLLYIPAAFLSHPDWGKVLSGTLIPHFSFNSDYIAGALALLGTTLTSYVYYWQTIEEREEMGKRPRLLAQLDAGVGILVASLIFWFILVATGATLGVHHQQVQTAQDAANALKPVAGAFASYFFAAGLLASALLALPVLAGTTAYAVGETLGWSVGLSRQPWRSQGFYLVLLASLLLVVPLTLFGIEPTTLLFVAGIVGGIGTPLLLVLMLIIAHD